MISRQLDSKIYNSSNYKLIVENNIQKIISSNVFSKVLFEVHFIFRTQFSYLVDMYKREYIQEKQALK